MNDTSKLQTSHMEIWDQASKTDPKYTKPVTFGRKFTAIDPHSQIMKATELFGPAGMGWGFNVVKNEYLPTNHVAVLVELWHGTLSQSIQQWGQCSLYIDKAETRPDPDCMKKATTDGITKCLSYLGLNADVFLGKFDDSKYIEERKAEVAGAAPPIVTSTDVPLDGSDATVTDRSWSDWVTDQVEGFKDYKSLDDLKFWHTTQKPSLAELKSVDVALHSELLTALRNRKKELN